MACLNYESAQRRLPYGSTWKIGKKLDVSQIEMTSNLNNLHENWVINILPMVEGRTLYQQLDLTKPISGNTSPNNIKVRAIPLPYMLCPSDTYNNVPFDGATYRVGRQLTVDPKAETFVGDKEADALLTREYRKPFVVPEKV